MKPGSVRDDLVCFLDLAPTVISLAGGEVPSQMQGRVINEIFEANDTKSASAAK